jgi:hypothetical protein
MKLRARKKLAVVQSISFEPGLLKKAKKKAKTRRRNLSAHICDLVIQDLAKPAASSPVNPQNNQGSMESRPTTESNIGK